MPPPVEPWLGDPTRTAKYGQTGKQAVFLFEEQPTELCCPGGNMATVGDTGNYVEVQVAQTAPGIIG